MITSMQNKTVKELLKLKQKKYRKAVSYTHLDVYKRQQYRFMLYYKIMTTLQQIGNNDLLKKYYQEINTCIPMNEEQKDLLEVIQEIFG